MSTPTCRFCETPLEHVFADVGVSPLANAFVEPESFQAMEPHFALRVFVCGRCHLVQLPPHEDPSAIFSEYSYFSSYSDSWLAHARRYAEAMIARFELGPKAKVVEVASNDGYLLRNFVQRGIGVLGVDPARNVAEVANRADVPTEVAFFGADTARRLREAGHAADLMAANNVLAHVPDVRDFVAGFKILLQPAGAATFEFPHLLRLIEQTQFDTIYHEHYSYLSLWAVEQIFRDAGLEVFDVEELPTHGGSLRVFACHAGAGLQAAGDGLARVRAAERAARLHTLEGYLGFQPRIVDLKKRLLRFLCDASDGGQLVAGYGAPAKGNTLLNYCGVGPELLPFTVDRSPHKQGRLLPGTRIPVLTPERIAELRPDYLLILPWNLRQEIAEQMAVIRDWGGKFVVAVPEIRIW